MASDLNARGVTLISVARHINRVDGLRGYFAGLAPCLLRAFPVNASALFVYEGILRLLNAEKVCPPCTSLFFLVLNPRCRLGNEISHGSFDYRRDAMYLSYSQSVMQTLGSLARLIRPRQYSSVRPMLVPQDLLWHPPLNLSSLFFR
jgi:Mitochondrial carrier protein